MSSFMLSISAVVMSAGSACIAAGFCPVVVDDLDVVCRFNWHPRSANFLRCSPSASCQRKFPAQCVTRDGIRAWRRYDRILKEHAQQMAHGLMARPVCGTPNAGPYCVHAPSGLGKVAELASWLLPMTFGRPARRRNGSASGDARQCTVTDGWIW